MAEQIVLPPGADRATLYAALLPQARALLAEETDVIAAMANMAAMLKQAFDWHWVGFYRVKDGQLVLGPFQGPVACSPIAKGAGVCGTAWARRETIVVPDVDAFPGHIACSNASRSEIVLPLAKANGEVMAVLDVDSDRLDDFGPADVHGLGQLIALIEALLP